MKPAVLFDGVSLRFGQVDAMRDLAISIPQGEVLVVLGPSGCGKTTLLRLIAGLIAPTEGRVLVEGQAPVPGAASALVFQNFRLLPWKTVADNLGFVLPGLSATERRARIAHYLDVVGMGRFANAYPRQLSGGMQQRVALARALCARPRILLMDEPFASLDAQTRELMQDEVRDLTHADPDRTVVFVTHSVDEALSLGDRVLLMTPRPGRVAEIVDVPFARQPGDLRMHPEYAPLREHLWSALRRMVLSDPHSDFHGRGV